MAHSIAAIRRYLEGLRVTQGRLSGELFKVFPWQNDFIKKAYGRDASPINGLSMARGGGKTSFCAAIACCHLDGPLMQENSDLTIVAGSFDQSRIAFRFIKNFMREKLEDRTKWRVIDSPNSALLENRDSGARVRCISSDARRALGLSGSFLADEPASWPRTTTNQMYAALSTALGKVPDSHLLAIGTRPADQDHWFCKLLADTKSSLVYAPSEEDIEHRWHEKKTWHKANPSLRRFPGSAAAN